LPKVVPNERLFDLFRSDQLVVRSRVPGRAQGRVVARCASNSRYVRGAGNSRYVRGAGNVIDGRGAVSGSTVRGAVSTNRTINVSACAVRGGAVRGAIRGQIWGTQVSLFVEDSNSVVGGVKSRLLYDFDQGEELTENREMLLKTLSGIAVVDRRYVIVFIHQ